MPEPTFTLNFNAAAERAILAGPANAMNKIVEQAVIRAKRDSPFKTGTNRRSISSDVIGKDTHRIFTQSGYGAFLELGTGIFGPKKKVIVLTRGGKTFTSKGMPARPYIRPTLTWAMRNAKGIIAGSVKGLPPRKIG